MKLVQNNPVLGVEFVPSEGDALEWTLKVSGPVSRTHSPARALLCPAPLRLPRAPSSRSLSPARADATV
jgi:hypothetical protein